MSNALYIFIEFAEFLDRCGQSRLSFANFHERSQTVVECHER